MRIETHFDRISSRVSTNARYTRRVLTIIMIHAQRSMGAAARRVTHKRAAAVGRHNVVVAALTTVRRPVRAETPAVYGLDGVRCETPRADYVGKISGGEASIKNGEKKKNGRLFSRSTFISPPPPPVTASARERSGERTRRAVFRRARSSAAAADPHFSPFIPLCFATQARAREDPSLSHGRRLLGNSARTMMRTAGY